MTRSAGRTQYYTAATLDGFIADPNHSLDWLFQFGESATDDYPDFVAAVGAIAMGSSTYEWVRAHIVGSQTDQSSSWPYTQATWVFTTRVLPRIDGAAIRFVRGDVRPVYDEMVAAAEGKNIWIVGGGDLAGQFHDQGLLDELIVTIASVTLGAGKPLLPRAITKPPLRLVSAQTYGAAFVQLRYVVPKPE